MAHFISIESVCRRNEYSTVEGAIAVIPCENALSDIIIKVTTIIFFIYQNSFGH
jgi:hypothetical protein